MKKKSPKSKVQGPKSARLSFLPGAGLHIGGPTAQWIAKTLDAQLDERPPIADERLPIAIETEVRQVSFLFLAYALYEESRLHFPLVRGTVTGTAAHSDNPVIIIGLKWGVL